MGLEWYHLSMKLITRNTDYAIRAACALAGAGKELMDVPTLVRRIKVPRPFLRKVLQTLGRHGIIKSYKGIGGGFRLARDPGKIMLIDIIRIFQGPFALNECFLMKSLCPERSRCVLKKKIDVIESHVLSELKSITLADIIKG